MKKKKVNIIELAKTANPRKKNRCLTCCGDKEMLDVVNTLLAMLGTGESKAPYSQIYEMLVEHQEYQHSSTALRTHFQKCRTDDFRAWQARISG